MDRLSTIPDRIERKRERELAIGDRLRLPQFPARFSDRSSINIAFITTVRWSCNAVQILKFTIRACRHVVLRARIFWTRVHVSAWSRIVPRPLVYLRVEHLPRRIVCKIILSETYDTTYRLADCANDGKSIRNSSFIARCLWEKSS